ncbi:apolipoL family protein [Helicobacter pylori]|nr:apolipoL family protein [Helicobacter pylori]
MHAHIDDGIEDDECKVMFEHELQKGMEKLVENIKKRFEKDEQQFREDLQEDIEQFEERIKNSLAMLEYIIYSGGSGFYFNIDNIDSGINKLGLFASIGGLVIVGLVNIWNPMGWIELTLAGLLGAIGIVKSFWSFFDSDYKKSQQRKEVDKNLHQICEKIVQDVKSRLESRKKDIREKIEKLKANLRPVDNYKRMKRQLKEAHERLGYISHSINLTISKQGACNEE